MKRLFTSTVVLLVVLGSLAGLGIEPAAAQTGITWTGTFYPNPDLSGVPVLTVQDTDINENWGLGAPGPSLRVDQFSVRWTGVTTLAAGTYQANIFVDDGVRFLVDGNLILDEFHPAPGARYAPTFTVGAGQHTLTVEYYDVGGAAYIQFDYSLIDPGQPPVPGQSTATVNAFVLNVRSAPGITGTILGVVYRAETYPVVGRNADASWWLIDLGNLSGWVSDAWVNVTNPGAVPVVSDGQPQPPETNATATVLAFRLNVRDEPDAVTGEIITQIARGQIYPIIGRNLDTTWWLLDIDGTQGWVSADWVAVSNVQAVPLAASTL